MRCLVIAVAVALIFAMGASAMTYEVDALYAEEAYEPYFIEINSMEEEPNAMEMQNFMEAEQAASEVPVVEAEAETETETEIEEVEPEHTSFAEAEEQAEVEAEDPPVATPAAPAPAAAPAAPVAAPAPAPAPVVAPVVVPASNSSNVTFVPAINGTWPTVPNPADPLCGCYNGATCQVQVCICPSQWTGQWCERPSAIALARQAELDRLGNLTTVLAKVSAQVTEIEASSGSPEAVKKMIADAARNEIIKVNVANAEREFTAALSRADIYNAREQLNLIKFMDPAKFAVLEREFVVQEQKINAAAYAARPGIAVMAVPVMQEDKYKDVDITFAKNTKFAALENAKQTVRDAKVQARQFNLVFGDPV